MIVYRLINGRWRKFLENKNNQRNDIIKDAHRFTSSHLSIGDSIEIENSALKVFMRDRNKIKQIQDLSLSGVLEQTESYINSRFDEIMDQTKVLESIRGTIAWEMQHGYHPLSLEQYLDIVLDLVRSVFYNTFVFYTSELMFDELPGEYKGSPMVLSYNIKDGGFDAKKHKDLGGTRDLVSVIVAPEYSDYVCKNADYLVENITIDYHYFHSQVDLTKPMEKE